MLKYQVRWRSHFEYNTARKWPTHPVEGVCLWGGEGAICSLFSCYIIRSAYNLLTSSLPTPSQEICFKHAPKTFEIWAYPSLETIHILVLTLEWPIHDPAKNTVRKITKWQHTHWFGPGRGIFSFFRLQYKFLRNMYWSLRLNYTYLACTPPHTHTRAYTHKHAKI